MIKESYYRNHETINKAVYLIKIIYSHVIFVLVTSAEYKWYMSANAIYLIPVNRFLQYRLLNLYNEKSSSIFEFHWEKHISVEISL